jgi:hypothetical protein
MQRAGTYGLRTEYERARFVDLTFLLARDFDTNARFAWAGQILRDRELSPRAKVERLDELAEEKLQGWQQGGA